MKNNMSRAHKVGRIVTLGALSLLFLIGLWWCGQAADNLFVKSENYYPVFYWTMLIAGIALWGLVGSSVLLKKPAAENVASVTIATLFAAYCFEGTLWALGIKPGDYFNRLERRGKQVDHRTPLQVVADMRTGGKQAVPLYFPALHVTSSRKNGAGLFPVSGVSRAFTVYCNEDGHYSTYTSDERGFKNPSGLLSHPSPFDIAIVGDSFTNGACVDLDQDLASHIRRRLPLTVSLGMDGNGPLIELATMKEYIPTLRPKLVLWFYYDNDLDDLEKELRDPVLRQYLDPAYSQNLINRQNEVDAFLRSLIDVKLKDLKAHPPVKESAVGDTTRLKRIRRLAEALLKEHPIESPVHDQTTTDNYMTIVDAANKLVAQSGGTLILVYLPDWTRVKERPNDPTYRQKNIILATASKTGVPVIDVLDELRARPDAATVYYNYPGSHFNKDGYRIVAEYVLDRIGAQTQSRSKLLK